MALQLLYAADVRSFILWHN